MYAWADARGTAASCWCMAAGRGRVFVVHLAADASQQLSVMVPFPLVSWRGQAAACTLPAQFSAAVRRVAVTPAPAAAGKAAACTLPAETCVAGMPVQRTATA